MVHSNYLATSFFKAELGELGIVLLQTISQPNLNSWALEHNRICSAAWFVYDILNREVDEKQLKQSIFYYVKNHVQKKMYKNTPLPGSDW